MKSIGAAASVMLVGIFLTVEPASGDPYISMGDSTSTSSTVGQHSSYVDLLYSGFGPYPGLKDRVGADEHISLAVSGEVLEGLKSEQLPLALDAINAPDDTKGVSVAIGGNDTLPWYSCFGLDTGCETFRSSYADLIGQLKAALDRDPGIEFLGLLAYYNPYRWEGSGFSQEDKDSLDLALLGTNLLPDQCEVETSAGLNDIILQTGNAFGAVVADPYSRFIAGGGSFLRDPTHANDAGERAIAEAFFDPVVPRDCNPDVPATCETDVSFCPADTLAPRTTITRKPGRRSSKRRAVFRFRSTERGSRFHCSLNGRQFSRCSPPRVYRKLRPGRYRFRVRAVDRSGNIDQTPARYHFRIQ